MSHAKKVLLWMAVALGFVLVPQAYANPVSKTSADGLTQRFSQALSSANALPVTAQYAKHGDHRRGYGKHRYHRGGYATVRGYGYRRHVVGVRPFVGRTHYRRASFVTYNRPYYRYRYQGHHYAPFAAFGVMPYHYRYYHYRYVPRPYYYHRTYYRTRYVTPRRFGIACRVVHRGHAHIGRVVRSGCFVPMHRNVVFKHYRTLAR